MKARSITDEVAQAIERGEVIARLNALYKDRFKLGDTVRVISPVSAYFGLSGRLIEASRFGFNGTIEFTDKQLIGMPENILRGKRQVHFYFRELQGVSNED